MQKLYRIRQDGALVELIGLRHRFPQCGFSSDPDADYLDAIGVDIVEQEAAPVPSSTQYVLQRSPEQREDGTWFQGWDLLDKSADQLAAEAAATRAQRIAEIDAERDERLAAGATWNANIWHADNAFQTQLTALISAFNNGIIPAGTSVPVRTKDNTVEQLGLPQLLALAATVLQHVQGVYAWSWAEKDALA